MRTLSQVVPRRFDEIALELVILLVRTSLTGQTTYFPRVGAGQRDPTRPDPTRADP